MLSDKKLLTNPELYQPLGSITALKNTPTRIDIDLNQQFMSSQNLSYISESCYRVYSDNGGQASKKKLNTLIMACVARFMKGKDLNDYLSAEWEATGYNNYTEAINRINNEFMELVYSKLDWNHFVPTRAMAVVGPAHDRVKKQYKDMTAADIGTVDVWANQQIEVKNSHFRYNNKIPFWQYTVCHRPYDLANEGFRENDPDRASLETPIHGYDMTGIYNTIDKWKKIDYLLG